jgi:tetratricopeptide (TPR) repeat protein
MSPESREVPDPFVDRLIRFDEELAARATPNPDESIPASDPALEKRLERARYCVELIERVKCHQPDSVAPLLESEGIRAIDLDLEDMPASIGRFQIHGELGRGGFGVVFRAHDHELDRDVALKIPRPEVLISRDLRNRFVREGKAIAGLSHSNILPVFEVGRLGGICYIASSYCDGPSLAAWAARAQPIPVEQAARLVRTLAEAVQHAHGRGVVHRDLKPSNVLFNTDTSSDSPIPGYSPLLTDFGLAKVAGLASEATRSGAILGTPAYMSPEQAAGRLDEVGPASDIYSLGAILYELLTGQPPFRKESDVATLQAVQLEEPVAPRRIRPEIPRDLEAVCLKCLEKPRDRRYPSATALAADLDRYLRGEPVLARPIGDVQRLARWCRRRPALTGAIAASVIFLVAGLAAALWQWRRAEDNYKDALASAVRERDAAAREKKSAEREKAEKDFTREALHAMTSQVAGEWLGAQRQLSVEQKRFLENTAAYYRRFAAEEIHDEESRARVGQAAFRLGTLLDRLGDRAAAQAAYEQARDSMRVLVAEAPDKPEHRLNLSKTCLKLTILFRSLGKWPEAEAANREAIEQGERLVRDHPNEPSYRYDLSESHNLRAIVARAQRRFPESEASQRIALELRRQLVEDVPTNRTYRQSLAHSLNNLATLLVDLARHAEAEPLLEESAAIKEQLVAEDPKNVFYSDELAQGYTNHGVFLQKQGRYHEAENFGQKGVDRYARLAAENPSMPQFRHAFAWSLQSLGSAQLNQKKWEEAERCHRRALTLLEELIRQHPEAWSYRHQSAACYSTLGDMWRDRDDLTKAEDAYSESIRLLDELLARGQKFGPVMGSLQSSSVGRATVRAWLRKYDGAISDWDRAIELAPGPARVGWRLARGTALVRAGRHDEALKEADQLTRTSKPDQAVLFNGAAVYAIAVEAVKSDPSRAEACAKRSIELLRQAMAAGFRDASFLKRDRDFQPIRERADFRDLVAELEQSTASASPKK